MRPRPDTTFNTKVDGVPLHGSPGPDERITREQAAAILRADPAMVAAVLPVATLPRADLMKLALKLEQRGVRCGATADAIEAATGKKR